ncbi:MAG: protein-export chaperone SecB [Thermodesulfobacteriota bacterium]
MSDNSSDKQQMPVFRLQKMYVKDLSFENPNAPEVFKTGQSAPKVDINMGLKNRAIGDDHYEVSISITAKVSTGDDNKSLFIIEVDHAGIFLLKNIPEEHMGVVLAVDCPTMLFPYTRQVISQLTVDGGFIPFLMEPVNFLGLYQNAQKQRQEQAPAQ